MKLSVAAVLAVAASAASVARADAPETAFAEYSAAVPMRPAQQLAETACDVEVELRGAVAAVEVRQRIANPGPDALAASYAFDLPPGAQLVGAALQTAARDVAVPVSSTYSTNIVDLSNDALGPDPAIVFASRDDGATHYRALLQPIAPDRDVTLITRYTLLAELRGGAVRVPLLGHPAEPKLTTCRVAIRATPGPGARVMQIHAGAATARGASATFTLDAAPLVLAADLETGRDPLLWTQSEDLGDGWSATVATVIAPAMRAAATAAPKPRRAVLVIDGSRSMELVGRHRVAQVVRAIGAALPASTELEAILYDRTATRVLGTLGAPTATTLAAIESAIATHRAGNGSDLAAAFALTHDVLAGATGESLVIVVTDGVIGEPDGPALAAALDARMPDVDVHAIVLDPAATHSPGADALRVPIDKYGGALVEVPAEQLDAALATVDAWLRPSILGLRLGELATPTEAIAGGGFTHTFVHRGALPRLALTGHGERAFAIAARGAPAAPIAQLVLADTNAADFAGVAREPTDDDLARGERARGKARARHPAADNEHAFAVLAQTGRVAASRRAMVKGGGPYARSAAVRDPDVPAAGVFINTATSAGPSAIARITLERLFRDQLAPRAYACYERALGLAPNLGGTVFFELRLGRGEISHAALTGLGNAQFDTCLLDAAYALQPPPPDFAINADDQTVAKYPLTFNVRGERPIILPGDADSSSPIDIDAVQGGVPTGRRGQVHVETSTPLGKLRPSR